MARASITTARYNPFTMEELYSPILRATEQHLQQQEKYDELANQASVWKYRIDSNSPEALQAYNDYMANLDTAVNDLYENGINSPSAKDNARNLIRNNPLHAFDEAYKRQVADNELRMKLGPDAIYVQENPTFDDYLKGTVNNTYQSADDVLKTSALVGTNLAKSITENPKYSSILSGQYWQGVQKNGIPPQVYYAVQSGDKSNLSGQDLALYDALDNAVNNVKDQIGYNNFASNPNALNKLDAAIWNGMSAGLQTTKYDNESNKNFVNWVVSAEENRAATKFNQEQKEYNRYHNPDGSINYGAYYADKAAEQAEIDKYWEENGLPEDEKPNVFTNTYGTKTKSNTSKKSNSENSTPKPRVSLVNPGLYSTSKNEKGEYSQSSYTGTAESDYTDKFKKVLDKYTPQVNLNALNNGLDITLSDDASRAIRKGKNPSITYIDRGKGRISSWELREQIEAITGMPPTEADKYYQITAYVNPEGELKFNIQHKKDVSVRNNETEQSTETKSQGGSTTSNITTP